MEVILIGVLPAGLDALVQGEWPEHRRRLAKAFGTGT